MISAISSGTSLIVTALSVIATSVICAILLKSITKGVAAYGCAIFVFFFKSFLLTVINTANLYTISSIAKYVLALLCPVFICLLFFLFSKIKEKEAISKKKFILKMLLVCLYPVMFSLIQIFSDILFAALTAISHNEDIINTIYGIASCISILIITLFCIAALLVFIFVFKDPYTISAAIACTSATASILTLLNNVVYYIYFTIDINFLSWYGMNTVNIILNIITSVGCFVLPLIPIAFVIIIPAVRNRKKQNINTITDIEEEEEEEDYGELADNEAEIIYSEDDDSSYYRDE